MELDEPLRAFSDLVGKRVCDRAGHSLGRLWEVRARHEDDGTIVIEELLVSKRALLRRLRGPKRDARGIPWQAIVELREDAIVVS